MAHWAEIDENNIVLRVLVGDNEDPNGDEGYQWLIDNLGGRWVKTSYNTMSGKHYEEQEEIVEIEQGVLQTLKHRVESGKPHFRYNYAGPGYLYDPIRDAFIPPKPDDFVDEEGNSFTFVLDEETCQWDKVNK